MICGVSCHITILELSFPGPNTRQVLESHIMTYIISPWKSELVSWLISPHVEESINFYMLRAATTWPLPQFDILSCAIHISGVESNMRFSSPLRETLNLHIETRQEQQIHSSEFAGLSSVGFFICGQWRTGGPETIPCCYDHTLAKDVQITEQGTQTFSGPDTQHHR